MRTKHIIIGITVLAIIVIVSIAFITDSGPLTDDMTLKDLGQLPNITVQSLEGEEIQLSSFLGKPLVVNSWASWCVFCKEELPDFERVTLDEGNSSVVIIAINRGEDISETVQFREENNLSESNLIFLLDEKDNFYEAISGIGMPETIFVTSDGVIREHKRGFMRLSEVRAKVTALLNNEEKI
tara:strand:+ start:41 stop:589 length:549 start_codon:yes stop_codon:yes gene_type:complete